MRGYIKIVCLFVGMLLSTACIIFSLPVTPTMESATPSPVPGINTATPTNTPAPTSLNQDGPHVLFKGTSGIWISNPDGSFLTRITEYDTNGDLRDVISPDGKRIALVVRNDQGIDLEIINIPGGETEIIARLISFTHEEEQSNPLSDKAFAAYAIRDYPDIAWQPAAGQLLAFTGAINGPTSDLYTYNLTSGEITQLTNGGAQAIQPIWSPDGQYILHYGVSWVPPFGGAIGGANQLNGAWSVRISDEEVITLPKPEGVNTHFVGWLDNAHYITYDYDEECNSRNLRSVDVTNGDIQSIMNYSFYSFIARSPVNGALLFSGAPGCTDSLGEGTFLLLPSQTTPTKVLEKRSWEIEWMPESNVFFAYPEALLSADGQTRYDSPVYDASFEPAVSINGYQAWEVIENQQGRVEVRIPGGEWRAILNGNVTEMIWDPVNGNTLLIALDDGSLFNATYPDFTTRLMGNLGGNVDQVIWLP